MRVKLYYFETNNIEPIHRGAGFIVLDENDVVQWLRERIGRGSTIVIDRIMLV